VFVSLPARLQASRQDRGIVAVPALADAAGVLDKNHKQLSHSGTYIFSRHLVDLRREARTAALRAARDYLQAAGQIAPDLEGDGLILAGHQPELFHPGVWVKNFAINGLARRLGAVPLNLVVDNDVAKSAMVRLPGWKDANPSEDAGWPHLIRVPFDAWHGDSPFEERLVQDEEVFASFPGRVREWTRLWDFEPMLPAFWAETAAHGKRTPLLGERLAAGRRQFEHRWGCRNFELPMSRLCRIEPFGWFACHVLERLPEFHAAFNEAVQEHRRQHGIRNANHPMPDLARDGDWLEAPFWAWKPGQARRGRVFARRTPGGLELRLGEGGIEPLPGGTPEKSVAAWQALEKAGYKIRTRALTTTLFARLFLGDVFMHGIGGGIYDGITDSVIRRFYRMEPPRFMVLSATLLLPFPGHPVEVEDCRRLARLARHLVCNPQKHLDLVRADLEQARWLAEQKEMWIARTGATRRERRQRYLALRDLTQRLCSFLEEPIRARFREVELCRRHVQANALLRRRDYAFCWYPEKLVRDFCTEFMA
jgi:hypothetical protein